MNKPLFYCIVLYCIFFKLKLSVLILLSSSFDIPSKLGFRFVCFLDKVLSISLVDVSSQLDIAEEMKKAGLAVSSKNLESTPSSSSSSLSSSSGYTHQI